MLEKMEKEKKPINTPFYYGWIVLAVAALGYFFSGPGQTYSVSIFIDHYIAKFGWSRSLISSLYSAATLTAGLILTVVGRNVDKFGHRRMIGIIATLFGLACFFMTLILNPYMLFVGFLLLRLLGQGSMSLMSQTLVPHWFKQKRGLALSIVSVGGVAASSALPPVNNWLIQSYGLNSAWIFWGVLLIFFMAPVGWFFVRNRPENIGLNPDGADEKEVKNNISPRVHMSSDPWTLKQAMTTRTFWFMTYCNAISALVNTGITFHIVSIIGEKGFSPNFAALILSIMALVQLPLIFAGGYLLDRAKVHILKGINYFLLTGALFLIVQAGSRMTLVIYAILHGFFVGFDVVSTGVFWPNYFGRRHLGSIRGFTMTAMVIGSSLGPLPFGIAYDIFGGYREIMLVMLILPVLAIIASFTSTPPDYAFDSEI